MVSVFERITEEMHDNVELYTPVRPKPFKIYIEADKVVFSSESIKKPIPMPKAIWNDIPNFLRGKGRVKIGMGYKTAEEGTLQYFIDHHRSRGKQHSSDANYVAVVLKRLKIVEIAINKIETIENRKSSKVRLVE